MKFVNNGKVTVCGKWTSKMKTHFYVSVTICSDKDKFNKTLGKGYAKARYVWGNSIVVPAKEDIYGIAPKLKEQLQFFLESNF